MNEIMGAHLRLPETWLKTKKLVSTLVANGKLGGDYHNHNTRPFMLGVKRSWGGRISRAEFTCYFPEYELFKFTCLTYGFKP